MNLTLQRLLDDACWDGNANLVAQLIEHPDVDPAAHHSTALLHAAHRGHWRCVELLIPVSNPKARNSEALWRACKHRHRTAARLLLPVSDPAKWEAWMWAELGGQAAWASQS
ncbi:ankyrin repeat domain-containing protein [Luteibacter sp. 329MFSha]|uniref:ankyrin repeat domain-containing protein n=1 Tax=Luteibacter sp. 329MFSha TaxID=1798239 RepID=UPI000B7D8DCB|nr:ankyrin repeat domain-containing protein [Luteibacter sp. 329MFSha]